MVITSGNIMKNGKAVKEFYKNQRRNYGLELYASSKVKEYTVIHKTF